MKRSIKGIFFALLMVCYLSYGQMDQYQFKRPIKGVNDQWHTIPLPDSVFGKVSNNLADLRIYGVKANKDTIEAPYLLRIASEKISNHSVNFNLVNTSHNEKGYYYTFELADETVINQLQLNFDRDNFDWKIVLEGSSDQQQWFTLSNDYRILSIQNQLTDYRFTKVSFPNSKYRYFRLLIKSDIEPNLINAQIFKNEVTQGNYRDYSIKKINTTENKSEKRKEIVVDLGIPVPISSIALDIKEDYDYYRHITIAHITDSVKTEQGWKYDYNPLFSGTLSSLEDNKFVLNSTIVQKLKISLYHGDNQPLTIDAIRIRGYVHNLVVRFTDPASYFLVYGNNSSLYPSYDIKQFAHTIPLDITPLTVGKEEYLKKGGILKKEPLFKNKAWLWGILSIVILILGTFSIKMMKTKQ